MSEISDDDWMADLSPEVRKAVESPEVRKAVEKFDLRHHAVNLERIQRYCQSKCT